MEIKVREVTDVEEKSTQQVEQELLNKHEEQFVDSKVESTETPKVEVESKAEAPVIPVYFDGVGSWLPKGDLKISTAGVVKVKYGAPIYSTKVEDLRDKCFDAVVELSRENN